MKKEDMAAGSGYDQSYAQRTGKAPDWHCLECKNKNFGWRDVCNRCSVLTPQPCTATLLASLNAFVSSGQTDKLGLPVVQTKGFVAASKLR